MSYSRYKMLRKLLNGIPQDVFTQGDLIQVGPFDSYEECQEGNASPDVTPDTPDMQYRWVTSNEPWCEGWNEYKTEKQQQSPDNVVWTDTGATRRGEFVQSHSFNCGFVAERWVNISGEFVCENGDKYAKQKKQTSTDGVTWTDSGDTRKGSLIEVDSADCGYPQYRWVEIPLDVDYECVGDSKYYKEKEQITQDGITWSDTGRTRRGRGAEVHSADCGYLPPTTVTRWVDVSGEYVCQGTNKYQKQKEQISYDSGESWTDTGNVRAGSLIESQSYDCGYVSYRWVTDPSNYVCQGTDKYAQEIEESTSDGEVWTPTGSTRTGALIERNSYDCDYVLYRWVTVSGEYVCDGEEKYSKQKEQSTTDGTNWVDTGRERAGSYIETDPSYCDMTRSNLTFEVTSGSGTLKFNNNNSKFTNIEYRKNDGEWTEGTSVSVDEGDIIEWRANNNSKENGTSYSSASKFSSTGNIKANVYGNINSLYDYISPTTVCHQYYALFYNCSFIENTDNLILPSSNLAIRCFAYMFYGCTSLVTTPELSATELAERCYYYMFYGCTSLTTAPVLLAETLQPYCYYYMFYNCTNLNYIKMMATDISASSCLYYWVNGVQTNSGTFVKNGCVAISRGTSGIPNNWTVYGENVQYRWVDVPDDFECVGVDKYTKQKKQMLCSGEWVDTNPLETRAVDLIESNSYDCGYVAYRWVDVPGYFCEGNNKYTKQRQQESVDGINWEYNNTFRGGTLIEEGSNDCEQSNSYLKLTAIDDGVKFTFPTYNYITNGLEFSLDDGETWVKFYNTNAGKYYWTPAIPEGNYILVKGYTINYHRGTSNVKGNGSFEATGRFKISGNPLSAVSGDFKNVNHFEAGKTLAYLFADNTYLIDASELCLTFPDFYSFSSSITSYVSYPQSNITTHVRGTFEGMFSGCTNLQYAPSEIGVGLIRNDSQYSYGFFQSMFSGCTSLVTGPTLLSSLTSDEQCYASMFSGCTSLTNAPVISVISPDKLCCQYMFNGCTSLTTVPSNMIPATELSQGCYSYMFQNCTSLTTAPDLLTSSTATYRGSYNNMFQGCTNLNYIKMLMGSKTFSYASWVDGVQTNSGIFVKHPESEIPIGINGIPENWVTVNVTPITRWSKYEDNTMCENGNLYALEKQEISYNEGLTWEDVSPFVTRLGELIESGSDICPQSGQFLTFTSLEDNNVFNNISKELEYSIDGGNTWVTLPANTDTPVVNNGRTIMFKGTGINYSTATFTSTKKFNASGCIDSLIFGDNYGQAGEAGKTYYFRSIFENCTKLVNADRLVFPTTLEKLDCYKTFYGCTSLVTAPSVITGASYCSRMFEGCTSLVTAPSVITGTSLSYCAYMFSGCTSLTNAPREISATSMNNFCCEYMFEGCTSLTTAPRVISATSMGTNCCQYMFKDCGNLRYAPTEIYATSMGNNCCQYMFQGCSNLLYAPALPATTIGNNCYQYMFEGCTSLTTAPSVLPATTIGEYCYQYMFSGCTSLTNAPELLATTIGEYCCQYMFYGCTSLTNAPSVLPATTIGEYCYRYMFDGCTSLTTAPELPATTLGQYCYSHMFYGCSNLLYVPALPATTLASYCYSHMFYGCTSLTNAPELPATTLGQYCYYFMFYGCTSLATVPSNMLPATTLAYYCYCGMFQGCTSLTTAPELPATTLAGWCYKQMFDGCTSLTAAPVLPATILTTGCYAYMFIGCTSLATVPSNMLPATTLAEDCYYYMFYDCTSLTTAPELPAPKAKTSCYSYMFYGCTNLNYVKMLATNYSQDYYYYWLKGVASSGTFVKMSGASIPTGGTSGIPSGWRVETVSS